MADAADADLGSRFSAAAAAVATQSGLTRADMLQLYGFYKQATAGAAPSKSDAGSFDLKAQAKHKAWKACSALSKDEAMLRYCELAAALAASAQEAADVKALQTALHRMQHPAACASRPAFTFKDWRNGLGAQLSTLVSVWASVLHKQASKAGEDAPIFGDAAPMVIPLGGLRYANKARCPRRDLSCYFEPLTSCDAPPEARKAKAAKTPPGLAERVGKELSFRRPRDKWWFRKELMRYVFRPNGATAAMLERVRGEMGLQPPSTQQREAKGDTAATKEGDGGAPKVRIDQLVAIHVRRGDKRDLGAKERGEPFSDAMYVQAALALADELGASGFLLASSEPSTLERLPALLKPRPTYTMPGKYFVQVPEGLTPHQVIEKTKQEGGENDEGMSQIVQLLLLAECRAFLGTVTSNFGLLVTKLMAFRTASAPVAMDLSCEGIAPMQAADDSTVAAWPIEWEPKDKARCKGYRRHEAVPERRRGG